MLKSTRSSIRKFVPSESRRYQSVETEKLPKGLKPVPGPNKLSFWIHSLPGGKYHVNRRCLLDEYGPIVKMPSILNIGEKISDMEKVFRNDGEYPERHIFPMFTYYEKSIRKNRQLGLLASQGEEWWKLRSLANPIVLKPATVGRYTPQLSEIGMEFVERIRETRDSKNEISSTCLVNWAMESMTNVAFDKRLNLLKSGSGANKDLATRYLATVSRSIELSVALEFEPSLWEYIPTPAYLEFVKMADKLKEFAQGFVNEAFDRIEKNPPTTDHEKSILEKLIAMDKDRTLTTPLAMEFLFAGLGTTAGSATNWLHALAKNPEKQEKLREEVMKLPTDENGMFQPGCFNHAPYLRACFSESLRMVPTGEAVLRIAAKDLALRGYYIPKGSSMMLVSVCNVNENLFKHHKDYIPERFLRENMPDARPDLGVTHPFGYLPFGFGPRACVGRRIAELENFVLVSCLLRNYRIEANLNHEMYKKMGSTVFQLYEDALKFRFIDV